MCIPPGVRKYCSTEVVRYRQKPKRTQKSVTHFHFQSRVILPCAMRGDNTNLR